MAYREGEIASITQPLITKYFSVGVMYFGGMILISKTQFLEASDNLYPLAKSTNILLRDTAIIFTKDQPSLKKLNF